jgi:hypothetical protein
VVARLEHAFDVAFMAIGRVIATAVRRRSGLNRPQLRRSKQLRHLSRRRALRNFRNTCQSTYRPPGGKAAWLVPGLCILRSRQAGPMTLLVLPLIHVVNVA